MTKPAQESIARPRPDLANPLIAPHWRGLRDHKLLFQRCDACHALRWPPAQICPQCLGAAHEWVACEPQGTIWSVAVYERAYHPAFRASLPYSVVLVTLDCGVRYIARMRGADPQDIAPDMRVRGVFIEVEPDLILLEFELT